MSRRKRREPTRPAQQPQPRVALDLAWARAQLGAVDDSLTTALRALRAAAEALDRRRK